MLEIMPPEGAKKRFVRLPSAARAAGVNSEEAFPRKDFGHRTRSVFPETEDFRGPLRTFTEAVSCNARFGLLPKRWAVTLALGFRRNGGL